MTDLFLYIVLVFVELTVFLVAAAFAFIYICYRMKLPFALRLLGKQYFVHVLKNAAGFRTHIHLAKEIDRTQTPQQLECFGVTYNMKWGKEFRIGQSIAMCHEEGKSEPLELSSGESQSLFLVSGLDVNNAHDMKSLLKSKAITDLNKASMYDQRMLILLMLMACVAMLAGLALYFSYSAWHAEQILNNYLAKYFAGT